MQQPADAFYEKARILRQLGAPAAEYVDAPPKGSVDAGIRDLIDEINGADGFATTSSCAGRVSIFREGRKTAQLEREQVAGVGGKGAGGTWLFVSQDPPSATAGLGPMLWDSQSLMLHARAGSPTRSRG